MSYIYFNMNPSKRKTIDCVIRAVSFATNQDWETTFVHIAVWCTEFPEINVNGETLAEYNQAIIKLANAFGVKVLYHNTAGFRYHNWETYSTDGLHPTKYGHSLLANNDIRQLDPTVLTRYSTSEEG